MSHSLINPYHSLLEKLVSLSETTSWGCLWREKLILHASVLDLADRPFNKSTSKKSQYWSTVIKNNFVSFRGTHRKNIEGYR